jgi:hypothetical protein
MSRTYTYKPEIKRQSRRLKSSQKVVLSDYEIEFIQLSLGPNVRLQA